MIKILTLREIEQTLARVLDSNKFRNNPFIIMGEDKVKVLEAPRKPILPDIPQVPCSFVPFTEEELKVEFST